MLFSSSSRGSSGWSCVSCMAPSLSLCGPRAPESGAPSDDEGIFCRSKITVLPREKLESKSTTRYMDKSEYHEAVRFSEARVEVEKEPAALAAPQKTKQRRRTWSCICRDALEPRARHKIGSLKKDCRDAQRAPTSSNSLRKKDSGVS